MVRTGAVTGDQREAALVFARIKELYVAPLEGAFDLPHLQAHHAYIFQDLSHHQPGVIRGDTDGWSKHRRLEGSPISYGVSYAHRDIASKAAAVLDHVAGPSALRGLGPDEMATKLAGLYGDLDHAHCFYEGNSRTLREFFRNLAREAGYRLDWAPTGADAETRNRLYLARDLLVLERSWPGLDEARAMATSDRAEYEAWFQIEQVRSAMTHSLRRLIRDGLTVLPEASLRAEGQQPPAAPTMRERLERWREGRAAQPAAQGKTADPARPSVAEGSYDPRP